MTAGVLTDITRKKNFSQKKTYSVAAARVTYDMVDGTHFNEVFRLPANALVVDVSMVVKVPGQTNLTVDFGTDANEDALLDEVAADGVAGTVKSTAEVSTVTTLTGTVTALTLNEAAPPTLNSGTVALTSGAGTVAKSPRIDTNTGLVIGASFSAQPTAGEWVFVVEFIEYDIANGQLMNLGEGTGVTTI